MRKFLRTTKALLVAAGLCVGASAWAGTIATMGDKSKGWTENGNNTTYALAANKTLTLTFAISETSGGDYAGHYVNITQSNGDKMGIQPGGGFYYIGDAWGNTDHITANDVSLTDYKTVLPGSTVKLTVKRFGTRLMYFANITKGTTRLYHRLITIAGTFDEDADITVKLGADNAVLTGITDVTTDETIKGTLVGQEDNFVGFGTNNKEYTLAADGTLSLRFINYSGNINDADNWMVEVQNGSKYLDLQPNGGGWDYNASNEYYNVSNYTKTTSAEGGAYSDGFPTALDKADVTLTVVRSGSKITITAVQTCTSGEVKTLKYELTHDDFASVDVTVRLMANWSHLDLIPNTSLAVPSTFALNSASVDVPFTAGSIVTGTNVTAFSVNNATVNAYFDSNTTTPGYQPYTLSTNETVTVSFTAYHGWQSNGGNSIVQLVNSEGVALVSYTYNTGETKFKDVSFGGESITGFNEFSGRSIWSGTSGANGFAPGGNSPRPYVATEGWNPVITMTVSKNGYVSFRLQNTQAGTDVNYNAILNTETTVMDLAAIRIIDAVTDTDRSIGISGLSITTETTAKHTVTFAYTDTDDNSLSSLKPNSFVQVDDATTVESLITDALKASFYNGDNSTRYDYSTYSVPEDATTVTGDVTITLKFAAKQKCTYRVNAVSATGAYLFNILDDTEGYEGDGVTVPYDCFYLVTANQTLMEASQTDGKYKFSFTIDPSDLTKTVTYNATSTGRVVYYSEGEDIETLTPAVFSDGQVGEYASGCGVGVTGSGSTKQTVTTLPAGSYNIYVRVGGKAGDTDYWYIYAEDEEKKKQSMTGNLNTYNTGAFTLTEDTEIKFAGGYKGSSNASRGLDYIYIVQTSTYTTTATIGSTGYTTFSSPYPLNLATLSSSGDAITAYYAASDAISGSTVTLTSTSGKVPANTGLILKGKAGDVATITATSTSETTALTGNLLVGCDVATKLSTNANYYVLVNNDGAEFQSLEDYGATIPAGKAYLNAAANNARALKIVFGNESTGIDTVNSEELKVKSYYNLSGQRVAAPQKGLYIVNGKKVVVK